MENVAQLITNRAMQNNISISALCREAGVSRGWFEKLKTNVPKSLEAFLNIMDILDKAEGKAD